MTANIQLSEPYSVLIPDGDSNVSLPVLQCLGSIKNIRIYVLSNNPKAYIRLSRYTGKFFTYPKESGDEGRLKEIIRIVKNNKIDIVLPVDVPTIRYLIENGQELRELTAVAPYPALETFDTSNNKWLLAEWLRVNRLPCPTTILYQPGAVFEEKLSALTFPVLIKPLKGDGGTGIKFFNTSSSLLDFCRDHILPGECIVQSFVQGYDIDCSVLCQDGRIIASTIQKRIINDPYLFKATMNIDLLYDEEVFSVVKEIMWKLEWSGVVHFDLRYDEQEKQIKVIEMNPRFWSSIIGSFYAGVNFPFLATLQGLKRELPVFTFRPIRYVDAVTAVKIFFRGIINSKGAIKYYDVSKLSTHRQDPLPIIALSYMQVYKKIVWSFRKNK